MTPKAAYQAVSRRARRSLFLHDGLINLRKRRIRSDWQSTFCRLMRWPQDTAIERVDSKDAIIILRENSDLTPDDFTRESLDDLLRAALTFGISALDRYVHERVVRGIIPALRRRDLLGPQKRLAMPAVFTLQICDIVQRAHRRNETVRPANEVRKRIQELLHTKPFQSWEQIRDAFQLLGVMRFPSQVKQAFPGQRLAADEIRKRLNDIVHRRNRIVHEGDLFRRARGGAGSQRHISKGYVAESLDFLDDFVESLDSIP